MAWRGVAWRGVAWGGIGWGGVRRSGCEWMGWDGFECSGWGWVHLVPVDFRELVVVAVELELDLAAEAHDGPGSSRQPCGAAVGSHAHAGAHQQRHAAAVTVSFANGGCAGCEFIGRSITGRNRN